MKASSIANFLLGKFMRLCGVRRSYNSRGGDALVREHSSMEHFIQGTFHPGSYSSKKRDVHGMHNPWDPWSMGSMITEHTFRDISVRDTPPSHYIFYTPHSKLVANVFGVFLNSEKSCVSTQYSSIHSLCSGLVRHKLLYICVITVTSCNIIHPVYKIKLSAMHFYHIYCCTKVRKNDNL